MISRVKSYNGCFAGYQCKKLKKVLRFFWSGQSNSSSLFVKVSVLALPFSAFLEPMLHLLTKSGIFNTKVIIRIVALSSIGSGLVYCNAHLTDSTFGQTIDSMLLPQWSILGDPSIPALQHGKIAQSCLFKVDPLSSSHNSNDDDDDPGKVAAADDSKSIANAVAMVLPSLVYISVPKRMDGKSSVSNGSGTIIDSNGTILTCAHLVSNSRGKKVTSKGQVDVTLQDGRTLVGKVLNVDLHSDIALVKITYKIPLPAAKLGVSSNLRPGDWVVAMGSPISLQNTITAGVVSYVNRKGSELGREGMLREYIQIDCTVHPGNSGGPLVNLDGEVVGVNVLKLLNATGLSLAVPIDSVLKIMEQFKKNGTVVRPWLGLKMLDLNEAIISQLKAKDPLFPDVFNGVLVFMVTPGSPADKAGICPGDVVIEFQGKPVGSITEIVRLMGDEVGKTFEVVVKRKKDIKRALIVVTEHANPEL